jgi:uncharacterized protein (DUF3084 family)
MAAADSSSSDSLLAAVVQAQGFNTMEELGRLTRENAKLRQDKQWYRDRLKQSQRYASALRSEVADLCEFSKRVAALNETLATNMRVESRRANRFNDKHKEAVDHLHGYHQAREPSPTPRGHIY